MKKERLYSENDLLAAAEVLRLLAFLPRQEQEKFLYMIKGAAVICGAEV